MDAFSTGNLQSLREVFLLFTVPIGGGIPAGVLLAKSRGVGWMTMTGLYFLSDLLLALVFEPLLTLLIRASRHSRFLTFMGDSFKKSTEKLLARYGKNPGPFVLVTIAFGVDPMTGRAAALAAGHHFITGWMIAITGDMIFFLVIMTSTVWLNNLVGDGTWTVIIILFTMLIIPNLVRRIRH